MTNLCEVSLVFSSPGCYIPGDQTSNGTCNDDLSLRALDSMSAKLKSLLSRALHTSSLRCSPPSEEDMHQNRARPTLCVRRERLIANRLRGPLSCHVLILNLCALPFVDCYRYHGLKCPVRCLAGAQRCDEDTLETFVLPGTSD